MAAIDDYNKFLASKPAAEREYRTLEFYHSDFVTPLRFLADFGDGIFTLESTAPRNPSTVQLFTGLSMAINEPSENKDGLQALTASIGATGAELQDKLDLITPANAFEAVECIYRKYYSEDLTDPVLVLYLSITSVEFNGYTKNTIVAEDQDLASKSAGELYTLDRFPGLRNI